jgi:hypothetical protein
VLNNSKKYAEYAEAIKANHMVLSNALSNNEIALPIKLLLNARSINMKVFFIIIKVVTPSFFWNLK